MIIALDDTTSSKISSELLRARRTAGSPAQGMVLTMIIVCDESEYASAMEASMAAGREHPSRILLVVTAGGRNASLDAEVHIGEGTPGEVRRSEVEREEACRRETGSQGTTGSHVRCEEIDRIEDIGEEACEDRGVIVPWP